MSTEFLLQLNAELFTWVFTEFSEGGESKLTNSTAFHMFNSEFAWPDPEFEDEHPHRSDGELIKNWKKFPLRGDGPTAACTRSVPHGARPLAA